MVYTYEMQEAVAALASSLVTTLPSAVLSIATYVLSAIGLYAIAKRRGIHHPWLAWVPVADYWVLGSLSDQYQYVVRGENKSKRKTLLILGILSTVVGIAMFVMAISVLVQMILGFGAGVSEDAMMEMVVGMLAGMLGLCVLWAAVEIACAIIRFMALYDVYRSLDPGNSTLYLVLSILVGITEPFFLFFNRNKDLGMPPRRPSDPYIPNQTSRTTWSTDGEHQDFL